MNCECFEIQNALFRARVKNVLLVQSCENENLHLTRRAGAKIPKKLTRFLTEGAQLYTNRIYVNKF